MRYSTEIHFEIEGKKSNLTIVNGVRMQIKTNNSKTVYFMSYYF